MKRHALLFALLVSCGAARADPPPAAPVPANPPHGPAPLAPAPITPAPMAAAPAIAPSAAAKPAKPPASPGPAPAAPPPAPTATVAASGILGRPVLGPDGNEMGRMVDVLVDAGSNPRAAVIDVGGFLGVGTRRIAVNWSDLTFPPTGSDAGIKLDLTSSQISSAPPYTDQTQPAKVVEPPPIMPGTPPVVPPLIVPPSPALHDANPPAGPPPAQARH